MKKAALLNKEYKGYFLLNETLLAIVSGESCKALSYKEKVDLIEDLKNRIENTRQEIKRIQSGF